MKWEMLTFGRDETCAAHKWANRALAVPLEGGDVVLAECCVRCGTLRAARKSGTGATGGGSRARASAG